MANDQVLTAFAEAALADDRAALDSARSDVVSSMGHDAMVDAAAIVATFQKMTRVADSTGIPLDAVTEMASRDIREQLSENYSFREYGQIKLFLASDGGRVVGRVAAMVNGKLLEATGEEVGLFGFFECLPEERYGKALLEAAAEELRARGMKLMRGPMNFSIRGEAFFQVEGFDSPPTMMMPYSHPAYPAMAESFGLAKARDALPLPNRRIFRPPSAACRVDRQPGESAHRAGNGQPHLAVPFWPGHRALE